MARFQRRDMGYLVASPIVILYASFFGLLRDLPEFGHMWTASVPGDVAFCLAVPAASWVCIALGRRTHPLAGALAAPFLTAGAYMAAWAFTGPAGFGTGDIGWVFVIGWPGMLAMGALLGVVGTVERTWDAAAPGQSTSGV